MGFSLDEKDHVVPLYVSLDERVVLTLQERTYKSHFPEEGEPIVFLSFLQKYSFMLITPFLSFDFTP